MDPKECLTNEKIRKKFVSQFDLVNYAIRLAENMIMTGRDPRVKIESQNRSLQVLSEILNNKDQFDEIVVETIVEQPPVKLAKQIIIDDEEDDDDDEDEVKKPAKKSEKKKPRKAAAKA